MLILLFLIAACNVSSSTPVLPPPDPLNPLIPFTIFGRKVPQWIDPTHQCTMQNIVWSCLVTIFACTLVAVHPNVPDPNESPWTILKQRIIIMIYAVLGPEFVVMWALRQRIGAAYHVRCYNREFHNGKTAPGWSIKSYFRPRVDNTKDGPWTLTHGFLLEMHGLRIYQDGKPTGFAKFVRNSIPQQWNKATCLVKEPFKITEVEINDKSKGDFLSKLFVVLQTTWFIFQCLVRWTVHLPVTKLEVVTLAFASLNIITYGLWWSKPQNMHIAIPINVHTLPGGSPCKNCGFTAEKEGSEEGIKSLKDKGEGRDSLPRTHACSFLNFLKTPVEPNHDSESGQEENVNPLPGSPCHQRRAQSLCSRVIQNNACSQIFVFLSKFKDMGYWHWLLFIARPLEPLLSMLNTCEIPFIRPSPMFYATENGFYNWKAYVPFCLIATGFGSLHLIPIWTSVFPSSFEEALWKVSAFTITIQPVLMLCTRLLWSNLSVELRKYFFYFVALISGFRYAISRIILVVLAFTSLRIPSPEVYQNVAWTTFI